MLGNPKIAEWQQRLVQWLRAGVTDVPAEVADFVLENCRQQLSPVEVSPAESAPAKSYRQRRPRSGPSRCDCNALPIRRRSPARRWPTRS